MSLAVLCCNKKAVKLKIGPGLTDWLIFKKFAQAYKTQENYTPTRVQQIYTLSVIIVF